VHRHQLNIGQFFHHYQNPSGSEEEDAARTLIAASELLVASADSISLVRVCASTYLDGSTHQFDIIIMTRFETLRHN
jgi:hypothetical protein